MAAGGPKVGCTRVHCADRLIVDLCSRPAARSPRVGVSVMVRRMYRHGNERLQAQDRSQRARQDRSQISTTDVYKVSREMKASRRECLSLYTLPTGHIRIFPSSQQIPEYSPLYYNAPAIIHTCAWVPSPEYKNVHAAPGSSPISSLVPWTPPTCPKYNATQGPRPKAHWYPHQHRKLLHLLPPWSKFVRELKHCCLVLQLVGLVALVRLIPRDAPNVIQGPMTSRQEGSLPK